LNANDPLSVRDRWARLRFSIVGPLLAAPPEGGALRAQLQALAQKSWRHPATGLPVRFGYSTLERWFYAARRADDPVRALRERPRRSAGHQKSLSPLAIELLSAQYRAHPNWTAQLHADNLRVALSEREPHGRAPSYPSVRRYLKAQGLTRRAKPQRHTAGAIAALERLERLEVRSYEVEHVNALWHADFHKGSLKVLTKGGEWITPVLFGCLDDRSRLVCHLQWYTNEQTETLVHGVSQALQRRGLPRALMTDNGAAMLAGEFTEGLTRLGILHETTLAYSPYQNGKQESFWGRVEGRLLAMLQGEERLTLELLNRATQAWAEHEYHRAVHSEINTTPLNRYLAGPNVGRECPPSETLRAAFRIQVERKQRRSDGTVALEGQRFEIPSRYRHLEKLHLRYARWDLRRVDLVDARADAILCPIFPLDKAANADAQRRAATPTDTPVKAAEPAGMAPLMRRLLAEYAATGLPPAYLPTDTEASTPATANTNPHQKKPRS
jgi:putative transposase